VLLNAAAALYVSGNDWTMGESADLARAALESGAALAALERLREAAPREAMSP
jgi:anthranilate phosphoribosyltransferase